MVLDAIVHSGPGLFGGGLLLGVTAFVANRLLQKIIPNDEYPEHYRAASPIRTICDFGASPSPAASPYFGAAGKPPIIFSGRNTPSAREESTSTPRQTAGRGGLRPRRGKGSGADPNG